MRFSKMIWRCWSLQRAEYNVRYGWDLRFGSLRGIVHVKVGATHAWRCLLGIMGQNSCSLSVFVGRHGHFGIESSRFIVACF